MSKKHFIALADHINANSGNFPLETIYSLADFLTIQNSLFNRDLWLDYLAGFCGPDGKASESLR